MTTLCRTLAELRALLGEWDNTEARVESPAAGVPDAESDDVDVTPAISVTPPLLPLLAEMPGAPPRSRITLIDVTSPTLPYVFLPADTSRRKLIIAAQGTWGIGVGTPIGAFATTPQYVTAIRQPLTYYWEMHGALICQQWFVVDLFTHYQMWVYEEFAPTSALNEVLTHA